MKTYLFVALIFMSFSGFAFSSDETASFKVYGACSMCKERIEKAAKIEGVSSADWSVETKMLTVTYSSLTDLDDVHESIAEAGHDTEKVQADATTYENLPACCHYERKKE
jgi:copper chaperone CopZ